MGSGVIPIFKTSGIGEFVASSQAKENLSSHEMGNLSHTILKRPYFIVVQVIFYCCSIDAYNRRSKWAILEYMIVFIRSFLLEVFYS